MPSARFEPAIPAIERKQTYPLDRTATGIGLISIMAHIITSSIHSMKIDNSSIERVEEFKYLGTTLTNQNSIQEEIKSRLKLGNA